MQLPNDWLNPVKMGLAGLFWCYREAIPRGTQHRLDLDNARLFEFFSGLGQNVRVDTLVPRPGIRNLLLKSAHGDNRQPLQDVADAAAAKFDSLIIAQGAPLLYIFSSSLA